MAVRHYSAHAWLLVRREQCAEDGRRVLCHLTTQGHSALAKLDAPILHLDNAALHPLTESELHTFVKMLDRAREISTENA